ncbi:MAG: ribonuclease Z [Actinomycetota bacterium]
MAARELHVLGTASQAPTRRRNQNGYFLRWDGEGLLFDPGEGTQRQLLLAGIAVTAITRILITHFHGDHCLGLPGILQRLSLDRVTHPVDVYYPASGAAYFERLRSASIYQPAAELRLHAVKQEGLVDDAGAVRILAGALRHRVDALGWRVEEPDGRRMLPDRLAHLGVQGADIGRLQQRGSLSVAGREVLLEDVSEPRPGQSFAFVMDSTPCEGASRLARGVDLLVSESTFLTGDHDLAQAYGHMTAAQAAGLGVVAGARSLVLTHFSQRYRDEALFAAEAEPIFPGALAATDLDTIAVPSRTAPH